MNGDTFNKIGTTFDQGVSSITSTRSTNYYNPPAPADFEGNGIRRRIMSNSYAANRAHPRHWTSPVSISPASHQSGKYKSRLRFAKTIITCAPAVIDDEGRGMVQIGYKMAPKATLAFATADGGEVGFANNIRALAGIRALRPARPDVCRGHDLPMTSAISTSRSSRTASSATASTTSTAAGVSYFSSAANDIGTNGYESEPFWCQTAPASPPPRQHGAGRHQHRSDRRAGHLYAGGFHNFNPNPGQLDVAQTVNVAANNTVRTVLQWNDPYDQSRGAAGTQIYANTGTYVAAPVVFDGPARRRCRPFTRGRPTRSSNSRRAAPTTRSFR